MGLANEQGFPHEGQVDFVDNRLNPQTGAIRMRARLRQRGTATSRRACARASDGRRQRAYDAVLVPERAIGTDQTREGRLLVVGADGKPQPREVKLGALIDGMRVVQGGVKAGEHVVVDGLQRIMPGMPVSPQVLEGRRQGHADRAAPARRPPPRRRADARARRR